MLDDYCGKFKEPPDPERLRLLENELNAIEAEILESRSNPKGSALQGTPPSLQSADDGVDTIWANAGSRDSDFEPKNKPPNAKGIQGEDSNAGHAWNRTVGPYQISGVIARGGMGIVYRATDPRLGRPVAIKSLSLADLEEFPSKRRELMERFEREARAVASLSHPNIVELYDVGKTNEQPYAVMEFIDGMTLAERLKRGKFTPVQTQQLGMQVAGALATSHASGVIHRDLKPQNIMLTQGQLDAEDAALDLPRVKLVDFGLSRLSDAPTGSADDDSATRAGMILGTPGYMSPEQARGEAATSAADIFGLGCVLYETLYGHRAIAGDTPVDRLAATLQGSIEFEESKCETSELLCELIRACLQQAPEDRPTASDVYAQLRKFDSLTAPRSVITDGQRSLDKQLLDESKSIQAMSRRFALIALGGGVVGSLFGRFSTSSNDVDLSSIESIAVLTFQPESRGSTPTDQSRNGRPLAPRSISTGDILASAIIGELSNVDGLMVLPYRRFVANDPSEWVSLGEKLGVDALLMGTFDSDQRGLDWKLIDAQTGQELVSARYDVPPESFIPGFNVISQAEAASEVAKRIGRYLVTSSQSQTPPNPEAYGCMVKGRAYADADSTAGLIEAIKCFKHAHGIDEGVAEPLASIALASLNLASRTTSPGQTLSRVDQARESFAKALDIDKNSSSAQLAQAIYRWQRAGLYDDAEEYFSQEDSRKELDWQFQHQRGLFFAAINRAEVAIESLRLASRLNRLSVLVKTDLLRVEWFFGWESKVLTDIQNLIKVLSDDDPG
ncbi:MAG: protein kinase, partial [Planctomycetota bacterium]